ncbi:unnamed protein product, partial [Candidula unifasciata]
KKKTSPDRSAPLGIASTNGGSREWLEMNAMEDKDGSKKGKTKHKPGNSPELPSIVDYHVNKSFTMNTNDNTYGNGYDSYSGGDPNLSRDSMYDYDIDDSGPHREMAVDVPENFIANVKSAPRYPPPWSTGSSSHSVQSHSETNNKDRKGQKADTQQSSAVSNRGPKQQQSNIEQQPSAYELERLHRHQEALKKRREEEKRLQAEEEFLRASLRESKKLRALENSRSVESAPTGLVNTGYDGDEDAVESKSHSRTVSDVMPREPYLRKNIGVDDLFSCLHYIRNSLTTPEEQKYISFLRLLFQNEYFQQAVSLHSQLVEITARSPPVKPVTDEAEELHSEVQHYIVQAHNNGKAQQLLSLLQKPNIKNLLIAHDAVSQQALQPVEDIEGQGEPIDYPLLQYGEDTVKIIHLEKTGEHLGATVKNEGESVIIGRIVKGGVAEKSGLLHEGDEVLEVNGIDMRGRNINDVSEMLANMTGTITFMIIPGHSPSPNNRQKSNKVMHLRALFSYEPEDDPYIPCRELGISFLKGDILHAIALDDPNWWQAFREEEEEEHSLAGLIPSKSFAEQREALKISLENKENKRKHRVCACGRKDHKNKKKKKYVNGGTSEDYDEILSYEEIVRYYPQPNRKRPIVLIGPSNVGRNELQQRLLDSDADRFGAPVPHTTCPPRSNELQDGTYNHISREEFNMMIQQNQFVEFGYHQKHMYGTSFDAVRDVIAQGKVCLLKMQPETLKVIHASDLMPYVVFVRPPNLEKLGRLQDQLKTPVVNGVKKGKESLSVDEQLRGIIDHSREIEEQYGHLFDFILVNSDLDQAYTELLAEINRIEVEPQWVPAAWIK